jgi:hypothetical protein
VHPVCFRPLHFGAASQEWVKASDYLQSAVEKTAGGSAGEEGLAPDAAAAAAPVLPTAPEQPEPAALPRPKPTPWSPTTTEDNAASTVRANATLDPPYPGAEGEWVRVGDKSENLTDSEIQARLDAAVAAEAAAAGKTSPPPPTPTPTPPPPPPPPPAAAPPPPPRPTPTPPTRPPQPPLPRWGCTS